MKGKELFAVIDGIKKPLRQWAEEYDLTYELVLQRYTNGWLSEHLIMPERCDLLSRQLVHRLWGGRWYYRNERCKKKRSTEAHRWNDRQRWVYVG